MNFLVSGIIKKCSTVLGWPPDANRNMSVYLNNDEESSNNKSACLVCPDPKVLEGSQILVVVHTKPGFQK